MAWYKIWMPGLINFSQKKDIWLDNVFVSKFNFEKWECEPGGIEFELPSNLFDKPYQSDDFELEILEDVFIGAYQNLVISENSCTILQDFYDSKIAASETPWIWIKNCYFYITARPAFSAFLGKYIVAVGQDEDNESDSINIVNLPNQKYVINRYNKTKVGIMVRVIDQNNKLVFAGRVSEPPESVTKGLLSFTAKDEFDCLDIPCPPISNIDNLTLEDYIFGSHTAFKGEVISLSGLAYNIVFLGAVPSDFLDSKFSLVDDKTKPFDTFKKALDFYMKLTKRFLVLEQYQNGDVIYAMHTFKQMNLLSEQFFSFLPIDLLSLCSVDSDIQCKLYNGIGSVVVKQGNYEATVTNVYSTNYGELKQIKVEIPESIQLDLIVSTFAEAFFSVLGIIYQEILIESDSRIATEIKAGDVFKISENDQLQISEFVEVGVSDILFCASRSENQFKFFHIKDDVLNPIPPIAKVQKLTTTTFQIDSTFLSEFNRFLSISGEPTQPESGYKFFDVGFVVRLEAIDASHIRYTRTITDLTGNVITIDTAISTTATEFYLNYGLKTAVTEIQEDWSYYE